MTPKGIKILGFSAAVAVLGAAYSLERDRVGSGMKNAGAVFPGLMGSINSIGRVVIDHREKTLTMVRDSAGNWSMNESDGYSVSAKVADKVMVQLADLNYYESKTKKRSLYDRLHVEDPKGKESRAHKIRVFDSKGIKLVDLIAGRKRHNLVGVRKQGVYIRKPGNDQTWLAAGELSLEAKPSGWLVRKIVDIKEKNILSVVVTHPDGEVLNISKDDPKARNFTLHDIPEGKILEYETDPDNLAAVVEQLELDDVRKAGYLNFVDDQTTRAEFITRDGLKLVLRVLEKDKGQWAEVKAIANKLDASSNSSKAPVDVAKEINARVNGWIYKLPSFKGSRLMRRMADMVKDKTPKS